LRDLLADPIAQALMESDGVEADEVMALLRDLARAEE
jgi:hypothetical protein